MVIGKFYEMKIDLRKKKNIVFDLDGTLVESNDWHELAISKRCKV